MDNINRTGSCRRQNRGSRCFLTGFSAGKMRPLNCYDIAAGKERVF